jgi:hypothetical protein
MSTQPARGHDRHSGDDLPAGVDGDRLAAVLRAAAAPAHPGELAGEDAALAAFRVAAETEPSQPSMVRTVLAKVLTIKAVVLLAVAGSAGIVVAATGGVLPTPWSAPPPVEQSSTPVPAPTTVDTGSPTPTEKPTTPPETTAPGTPPIVELCHRYAAHDHPGKALNDPAFGPLVAAAGNKGKVADYCAEHVTQPPRPDGDKPAPGGDAPGKGKPTDKPGKEPGKSGDNPPKPPKPSEPGKNGNGRNPATPTAPGHHAGPPAQGG